MIASLAGFLMGFIGSMPVAGPTSLLVFHRGMFARYRDGWAIGLGGGLFHNSDEGSKRSPAPCPRTLFYLLPPGDSPEVCDRGAI